MLAKASGSQAGSASLLARPPAALLRACQALPSPSRQHAQATGASHSSRRDAACLPARAQGRARRGSRCRSAADAVTETLESSSLSEWLATATGYCVLAGACVRSIPQIIRIQRTQSAEGLSEAANLSELLAYSIMIAYNFRLGYAFNTYGEIVACWLQDIVLAFLIVRFNRKVDLSTGVSALVFAVAFAAMMTDLVSLRLLVWLQASTIFIISLGGRVPQIVMNVRKGGSGQLSITTCGMNVAGCFARMFTTLVLTQDIINFVGTAVQAVLNGILFFQCIQTARRRPSPAAHAA